MKVAIVSFGLIESIITLAKYLSRYIEIDLYILLAQSSKKDSIINFSDIKVKNGLLNKDLTSKILGKEIENYIENKFNVYFFTYVSYRSYYFKNIMLSFNFSKIIKERKYDLIHFNGNDLQQLVISFLTPGCPKVHTIHDYLGHSGERNYWAKMFNKSLVNSNKCKIIHSYGSLQKAAPQNYLQKKHINVIPFGPFEVYLTWRNNLLAEENNTILLFGRISPYKGIEYLVRAAPIIKEKIPDLKVTLAGEGRYYFNIESLKNNNTYQVMNRYIPNKELVELIQEASLIVCPYTDATQSGVIMTAYAFNKPVVATNVGGIPEVVLNGITGLLVPPKNADALADAIIDLLKNHQKRKVMAENIHKKFNEGKFSWNVIAQQTIEIYKKAIQENK